MENEQQIFNNKIQDIFSAHKNQDFHKLLELAKNFISDYENHIFGYKAIAVAYNELNDISNALAFAKKSIEIDANDDEALSNLSVILLKVINEAIEENAVNNFKNELDKDLLKQLKFIEKLLRRAIKINYKNAVIYSNLACVLFVLKRLDEAEVFAKKAIILNDNSEEFYFILATIFFKKENYIDAKFFIDKAIQLNPNKAEFIYLLGGIFEEQKQLIDSIKNFRICVNLEPNNTKYIIALLQNLDKIGQADEAFTYAQKLLELKKQQNKKISFFELSLPVHIYPYTSNPNAETMGKLARNLVEKTTLPADKVYKHKPPKFSPKKLKIGFVSGDLKYHPVAYFLLSTLHSLKNKYANLDFYAYSTCPEKELDNITEQLKTYFVKFKNVNDLSDAELAKIIYEDNINILFDLSGYTKHHRLTMFAYQPAPIQITWIGWHSSTGVAGMNYFLVDKNLAPPPLQIDAFNTIQCSEKIYALPHIWECYTPRANMPEVTTKNNKKFTFGCFHNLNKVNYKCIDLWSEVFKKIPDSKFIFMRGELQDKGIKNYFINEFVKRGVDPNNTELYFETGDYYNTYNEIDLILDTLPISGMTTTADALYMGVPVLTLIGNLIPSRLSASCLKAVGNGLENLICHSEQEFIDKAIYYANNKAELNLLKTNLRQKTLQSSLCDADLFADNFYNAMQEIWQDFLHSK